MQSDHLVLDRSTHTTTTYTQTSGNTHCGQIVLTGNET